MTNEPVEFGLELALLPDLTKQQKAALIQAKEDGGEIQMTGIDRTDNCPSRITINNLVKLGLLNPDKPWFDHTRCDEFKMTALGKAYLKRWIKTK